MKKKLIIKQRIKACFILLFSNSTLSYVVDLEERCKKAKFAPFSLRVPEEGEYFVWDEEQYKTLKIGLNNTIQNMLNSIVANLIIYAQQVKTNYEPNKSN